MSTKAIVWLGLVLSCTFVMLLGVPYADGDSPTPMEVSYNQYLQDANTALAGRAHATQESARAQNAESGRTAAIDTAASALGNLGRIGTAVLDGKAMMDAFRDLTPGDSQYDPDYSPPGSPEVPSSCAGSDACGECYQKAQTDINFMRFNLEKLRSTCRETEAAADRAMKFGDDVSSIHGGLGIAWQNEKIGIVKKVEHLKQTCRQKYDGMMTGTEKAIREMDRCEAEFFNNRDWYDRYGFLYYQFLRARYEPEK
jgi:hypothetical protein